MLYWTKTQKTIWDPYAWWSQEQNQARCKLFVPTNPTPLQFKRSFYRSKQCFCSLRILDGWIHEWTDRHMTVLKIEVNLNLWNRRGWFLKWVVPHLNADQSNTARPVPTTEQEIVWDPLWEKRKGNIILGFFTSQSCHFIENILLHSLTNRQT